MEINRLRHLAGLCENTTIAEDQHSNGDLTYDGFKLEQYKEYSGNTGEIVHCVSKGGKHVATLDHDPQQWIDESTFKKYIEFYQKHGRFPTRDNFGPGVATNEKIKTLKESTDSTHYNKEKDVFDNVLKSLDTLEQFLANQAGDDYRKMSIQTQKLSSLLKQHLESYK